MVKNEHPRITKNVAVKFGRPCIINTGIPAEAVMERFIAGESMRELARDYAQGEVDIEAAIRYEYDRLRERYKDVETRQRENYPKEERPY